MDLPGVCDDGEDVHGRAAACADHGALAVCYANSCRPGDQPHPGIRKVLQNLGREVGRGEELGVGAEAGIVLCVVQEAAGKPLAGLHPAVGQGIFNQELLERDRRPGASRALEEEAPIFTDRSTLNPLCVQSSIFFASRSLWSLRRRKKAIVLFMCS